MPSGQAMSPAGASSRPVAESAGVPAWRLSPPSGASGPRPELDFGLSPAGPIRCRSSTTVILLVLVNFWLRTPGQAISWTLGWTTATPTGQGRKDRTENRYKNDLGVGEPRWGQITGIPSPD